MFFSYISDQEVNIFVIVWTEKSGTMFCSRDLFVVILTFVFVLQYCESEYISNLDVNFNSPTYEEILKRGWREQELHRMRQRRQVREELLLN